MRRKQSTALFIGCGLIAIAACSSNPSNVPSTAETFVGVETMVENKVDAFVSSYISGAVQNQPSLIENTSEQTLRSCVLTVSRSISKSVLQTRLTQFDTTDQSAISGVVAEAVSAVQSRIGLSIQTCVTRE